MLMIPDNKSFHLMYKLPLCDIQNRRYKASEVAVARMKV